MRRICVERWPQSERTCGHHTSSSHLVRYLLYDILLVHPQARGADWHARYAAHGRWAMPCWQTRGRRREMTSSSALYLKTQGAALGVPNAGVNAF